MIKFIVFIILLALIHSRLELQIEGKKFGWAYQLPCWRWHNKIINWLIGKDLTGYHFWLLFLFFCIFHSSFLFIDFTLKKEFVVLGLFCWYWIFEDFWWFLFNDFYGLKNFKEGKIFWHKRWIWFLPVSYFWGILLGTTLLIIGGIK